MATCNVTTGINVLVFLAFEKKCSAEGVTPAQKIRSMILADVGTTEEASKAPRRPAKKASKATEKAGE